MKRFIVKTIALLIVILVVDAGLGVIFQHMVKTAKGGETGRMEYICHKTNEDLLIFGSSRAAHHYDPRILEDSLHMTCYNCGKDGNGIILLYGWYKILKKHYQPRVILYDIEPSYDLLEGDNSRFLSGLRYYYDESPIDSIFWKVEENEQYKMMLSSYRFNSQFLQLAMDNIEPLQKDFKGYRPLYGEMSYEATTRQNICGKYRYDSLKLYYLERFIVDCKESGTQLIFATSPQYKNTSSAVLTPIKNLCRRYDVPFIDHYTDDAFNQNKKYFRDSAHLNEKGATNYTLTIAKEIKRLENIHAIHINL